MLLVTSGITDMRRISTLFLAFLPLLSGCPSSRTTPAWVSDAPPLVLQLQQQDDSLLNQRVRTLLDFESESDAVFARSDSVLSLNSMAHTGRQSLLVNGRSVTLRIGSVLFSTKLPGEWSLLGAYVRPQVDTPITVELMVGERIITKSQHTVGKGRWTFSGVDLTEIDPAAFEGVQDQLTLRYTIENAGGLAGISLDDVLLIDNKQILVDTLNQGATGWRIARQGYKTTIDAPHRFNIRAATAAGNDRGWVLREYGDFRAILQSVGPVKHWVLYSDGRYMEDHQLSVKGASGDAVIASHQKPAEIRVEEATGKLDCFTDGDDNNDGYNERLGAYQLVARSGRMQLRVIPPAGVPAAAPVLEIHGLPDGRVSATVEGRLIDRATRLPDGRVLLILPLEMDRPMSVTIRSTQE